MLSTRPIDVSLYPIVTCAVISLLSGIDNGVGVCHHFIQFNPVKTNLTEQLGWLTEFIPPADIHAVSVLTSNIKSPRATWCACIIQSRYQ
jgi:hypothetical protein